MSDRPAGIRLDPEHLDGHTIEELSEYLDAGRIPRDPSIEDSAGCRLALAALEHLRTVAGPFLDAEAAESQADDAWISRIIAALSLDARAGRDLPLAELGPQGRALLTEGALRAIIRSAGDAVPGLLVGRVRIRGDVERTDAELVVAVTANVAFGVPIPSTVEAFRAAATAAVARHTSFRLATVDVEVRDLHVPGAR